ncbi:MAG: DNA primase catalytic subunit PriS [Thermoplasmata archaeon]
MSDTISFIKKRFSDYYRDADLYLPDRFGRREWGFMFFEGGFMQRHLGFQSVDKVKQFLVQKVPAHVYHSSAYYQTPDAPSMREKGWLGADLIFDLDADHVKGAKRMSYEETLRKVKEEFKKLIDKFLLDDFGFEEKQLLIVFSGGRGYHIHIRDPRVLQLKSHERREMLDYITGKDVDMKLIFKQEPFDKRSFGPHVKVMHRVLMPDKNAGGWKKKMREGLLNLTDELENLGEKEAIKKLSEFKGIGKIRAKGIYSELFEGDKGNRGVDRMRNEGIIEIFSDDKYRNPFLEIVKGEASVKIEGKKGHDEEEYTKPLSGKKEQEGESDEPVTSDIKRLIRLPSSLHGKTGLKVMPLSRDGLDDFDPLRDAVPKIFSDEPVKIEVKKPVRVKLKNEAFDLKEGEVEVPEYAAIFLMCRRNAELFPANRSLRTSAIHSLQ